MSDGSSQYVMSSKPGGECAPGFFRPIRLAWERRGVMRLDKYLKVSRLIKRRTVANEACDGGRVTINGRVAKASAEVKQGDVIAISFGNREVKVEVLDVQETVKKEAAAELFRYL